MFTYEEYLQLDNVVLRRTNVKEYVRGLFETEDGNLDLHCDGKRYFFMQGGKDITTPELIEAIPELLSAWFKNNA